MINRPFLASIAFRLPFAIAFICILVFSLATVAAYGLQRARDEMAAYGVEAFSSLSKAALVSRQVSDLVSSAPFLMNAASPYRVSSESRAVVQQVDNLLRAMEPNGEAVFKGFASTRIIETLEAIRTQTTALASDADTAQQHKAGAAAALGEIATGGGIRDVDFRRSLNSLVQSASNSDSLFQLGELRRRYVAETTLRLGQASPDSRVSAIELAPYERIFTAQTDYLLEMFAIRAAVARLHTVSRELSQATEAQSEAVAHELTDDLASTSNSLNRLLIIVAISSGLVLVMTIFSIRSVMRVSRGIVALSNGMNALAEGRRDVAAPLYRGTETELVQLLEAFRAFRESVERVSRLRRTAQAAARTIRSTFRNMNEGIALFDPQGRPITMNRRVMQLVGWSGSARKLPLRRFVAAVPEIDAALLPFGNEIGSLQDRSVLRHRAPDGSVTEISLSRQPDGGIVLLARDVTDLDQQEADAARVQRLDSIMRMTHQVSHEVGNMIGIITGSLGLLERDAGLDDRQKRHIARIRKAADRGRSLAGSMLSIGSQQPISPDALELGALLRGMADVLEIAVGEKCLLTLDIAKDLPKVTLDPALFEQAILNLCLNAAAAMPAGGTIFICCQADGESAVSIAVTDNGIGLSPEGIDKAFEPYFTTRFNEGGAGLGLAVVYGFMRQIGGDARILSELGKGTTVELRFPV